MNLLEKGSNIIMGILSGNPQHEPLHYGEILDYGALYCMQKAL